MFAAEYWQEYWFSNNILTEFWNIHLDINTSIPRIESTYCLEFRFFSRIVTRILISKQYSNRILEHTYSCQYFYTQNRIKILLRISILQQNVNKNSDFKQNFERILEHASATQYIYIHNTTKILLGILILKQKFD